MSLVPLDSPPVLLVAGIIGYALRNRFGKGFKNLLGNINILFFMPLVMGVTFAKRGFQLQDIWVAALVLFYVFLVTPLALYLTKGFSGEKRAGAIISSIFPNSVNLPLPILLALRGDYSYAAVYAIVINLIHVLYVVLLATMLLSRERGWRETIGFFLKGMTPLYGAIIGYYIYTCCQLPPQLWVLMDFMKSLGIFMFVMVAGLSMPTLGLSKLPLKELRPVVLTRFVLSPLLVVMYAGITGMIGYHVIREAFVQVLVESVMPPAVINVSYSAAFGFDTEYVAISVVILTLPGAVLGSVAAYLL